jgi:YebC/PmpR family DNA-binding regulatory protein
MGAQWKQAGRVENAMKRGQIVGKCAKEITVAAKLGGTDPDMNARLYAALEAARKHSVPRDTIDRALKRGAGLTDDKTTIEHVVYEGFTPAKVPVVVECLTDNKNRTASDIRVLFRDGHLGGQGSVAWMFDHLGVVEAHHPDKSIDIEGAAIEANAQNVEPMEESEVPEGRTGARFFCLLTDLNAVSKFLTKAGWQVTVSEMRYIAKNPVELKPEDRKVVVEFLSAIDDHDDVHRVYAGLK